MLVRLLLTSQNPKFLGIVALVFDVLGFLDVYNNMEWGFLSLGGKDVKLKKGGNVVIDAASKGNNDDGTYVSMGDKVGSTTCNKSQADFNKVFRMNQILDLLVLRIM